MEQDKVDSVPFKYLFNIQVPSGREGEGHLLQFFPLKQTDKQTARNTQKRGAWEQVSVSCTLPDSASVLGKHSPRHRIPSYPRDAPVQPVLEVCTHASPLQYIGFFPLLKSVYNIYIYLYSVYIYLYGLYTHIAHNPLASCVRLC